MIRYASPCCASAGATKSPSHNPTAASSTEASPNQRASRCASGKNDTGEAYRNQLIEVKFVSCSSASETAGLLVQRDAHRRGACEGRAHGRGEERRTQHGEFACGSEPGMGRTDGTCTEDQDRDVQRQDQERQQR